MGPLFQPYPPEHLTPPAKPAVVRGPKLSIGAVVAVMVDEAGRWTEATPLGFTVGDNGHVRTVDLHGPAAVSTLKARFPRLAVTTVAGQNLWGQLPHNRPAEGIVVDGAGAVWRRADTPTVDLRFFAGAQVARGGQVDACDQEPDVVSDDDGIVDHPESTRAPCGVLVTCDCLACVQPACVEDGIIQSANGVCEEDDTGVMLVSPFPQ